MKIIAGVDEVGRGSLIGPVYAAAVILNKSINYKILKDSKSLTKEKRESLFDYIKNNSTVWEHEPMTKLVKKKELSAYRHTGFYQPMDTINEKNYLEKLWKERKAPWKV